MHVVLALTAVSLALFAHTMTMFYFIGTAKKIKEFIESWEDDVRTEIRARTIATKKALFPMIMLSCLLLMAAFILGGAHDARVVSRSVHTWVAYGALLVHVHTASLETIHLLRNVNLIREVNDLALRRNAGETS